MAQGSSQNAPINIDANAAQPTTLVAGVAGYAVRVMGYLLAATGMAPAWPDGPIAQATWQDTAGNTLSGPLSLRESLPFACPVAPQTETDRGGWFETTPGAGLALLTAGANVMGHLTYIMVPR